MQKANHSVCKSKILTQEWRLSGAITKIIFIPDQSFAVSVGSEGAIFIWATSQDVQDAQANKEMLTIMTNIKTIKSYRLFNSQNISRVWRLCDFVN